MASKFFRKLKILIVLVLIAGIAVVAYIQLKPRIEAFRKAREPEELLPVEPEEVEVPQEPILVKVYQVQKKDFEDNLPILGTIKGFKEIDLKFEVSGMLDSFNFREGERIEEGEIIATVSQKDALLKLKYTEIEYQKHKRLHELGAITKSKLDQVRLELESAKRELDKTYLYAPQDGVLGVKDSEVGEYVSPNDKVATLIDDSEIFVEVGVIEKDIGKVKIGQKATVVVDTYPDRKFDGHVDNVSPVIEGKARTQTAKIKVINKERMLLPGMFARNVIAVYKKEGAIVIPNSALDRTEEGYVTYVIKQVEEPLEEGREEIEAEEDTEEMAAEEGEDKAARVLDLLGIGDTRQEAGEEMEAEEIIEEEGIAEVRSIKADYRSAEFFVIESGLNEGELVVVETQEKLKEGYKVIIAEVQEAIF